MGIVAQTVIPRNNHLPRGGNSQFKYHESRELLFRQPRFYPNLPFHLCENEKAGQEEGGGKRVTPYRSRGWYASWLISSVVCLN
jgi:hypothetical protein